MRGAMLPQPPFPRLALSLQPRAWHHTPGWGVAWSTWRLAGRDGVELDVPVTLGQPSGLLFCVQNSCSQEGRAPVWPVPHAPGLAPRQGRCPSFLRACVHVCVCACREEGGRSGACPKEAPGTAAQPAREGFTFLGSAVGQALCLNNPGENHLAKLLVSKLKV